MGRTLLAAALLAATAACQNSWTLSGQALATRTGPTGETLAPVPAAAARVTLQCPGDQGSRFATLTNADGAFTFAGSGSGPGLDCKVTVESSGLRPATAGVDEGCTDTDESGARCLVGALLAELTAP